MSNNYWNNQSGSNNQYSSGYPNYSPPGYTDGEYRAGGSDIIQDPPVSYYSAPPPQNTEPPRPEKRKKKKGGKGRVALLLVACLVISLAGGYAGASLANPSNSGNVSGSGLSLGDDGVMYLPVERVTDSTDNDPLTTADVVAMVEDSVVEVTTEESSTSYFFQQYVTTGAGSGVIISTDGYIVTCAHVIDGATNIKIKLNDGTEYSATLIGSDNRSDIALLKIDANGLTPAVIGDSDKLVVGEGAIAIGNPLGSLGGTVTTGIISALSREVMVENQSMTLLQTNAAVNPGNSGGGLFNMKGDLVGIVNAKSYGEDIEGLGFAIPSNDMRYVVEQLRSSGYVSGRPALGISAVAIATQQQAQEKGVDRLGVYVEEATSDEAKAAGLQKGDYILSIDGSVINSFNDIQQALSGHAVGDTVQLQIIRNGQTLTIELVLSELQA